MSAAAFASCGTRFDAQLSLERRLEIGDIMLIVESIQMMLAFAECKFRLHAACNLGGRGCCCRRP